VLTPILATDDPYEAAAVFVTAGWSLVFKGAGVEFHVTVPGADIGAVYEAHRRHADSVTELADQPWGERAFHAVLLGYWVPDRHGGLSTALGGG
jgi:hypothetical protein